MQRGAIAMLHAVIGPESLRQAIKLALGIGFRLMLTGKATMVGRMPVLACDDGVAARQAPVDQLICDINGAVAFGDGECAASAEIVLQVYQ